MGSKTRRLNFLNDALRYAEMGYPVFPCVPGTKIPFKDTEGVKEATTDEGQIIRWWTDNPDANIAISTRGLLVVDVDGKDNPWPGDDGQREALLQAPTAATPKGGRHHVFLQPGDGNIYKSTTNRIADRVDTRADGGYILVFPSVFSGKQYRWVNELEGREALEPAPEFVTRSLDGTDKKDFRNLKVEEDIPEGMRNDTLTRIAGSLRRIGLSEENIYVAIGQTNSERCNPPLKDSELRTIARSVAQYEPDQVSVAIIEDYYNQIVVDPDPIKIDEDPGLIPERLLVVPGLIEQIFDYTMATAPYPNVVMAACGAISMMGFLAGRKVCDSMDIRTNLYLLALGMSGSGKDHPRKVNMKIADSVGLGHCIGDGFASGEGIQDSLFVNNCILLQTDEIDAIFQSINKANDARHEMLMNTLLRIFSAANNKFRMRYKAGTENERYIDQPHLMLYGTAIPTYYYEALSHRMLTNGLFSRMVVLESYGRGEGQEITKKIPIPETVLNTAKWWAEFRPGSGDLEHWFPEPRIIPHTKEGRECLIETRRHADIEWKKAEENKDVVGTTVWSRVAENVRKFSLIRAVSESNEFPEIDENCVKWATEFIFHLTHRMLYMAKNHVSDSTFDKDCKRFIARLSEAPDKTVAHSVMMKRMKMKTRDFQEIVTTLAQSGQIVVDKVKTSGRAAVQYKLNVG